jgi:uncharacterized membrane protein
MILAAVGDTSYNILLVLHILSVVGAMAPALAHPVMNRQIKTLEPGAMNAVYGFMAGNSQRVYGTALILAGVFGFGLVGMSGDFYSLTDGWIIASWALWIVWVGIIHAVLVPAERALAGGDSSAESKVAIAGTVTSLVAVVVIILMTFKPGA